MDKPFNPRSIVVIRILTILLVVSLVAMGCGQTGSSDNGEQEKQAKEQKVTYLLVGTTNQSSSLYSYYVGLSKSITEVYPNLNVTIMETGASIDNIRRTSKGELDLGLTGLGAAYQAYNGLGTFEGEAVKKLRLLNVYSANAQSFAVRKDAQISSVHDLDGKKFSPGQRGSATEQLTETIFKVLGIEPEWVRGSVDDEVNAVKDNRSVGFVKLSNGVLPDGSVMDLNTLTPVEVINWGMEDIKKVQEKYPYYGTAVIPAGTYSGQDEDILTWATLSGTFTTTDLSEEVAYQITKAIFENKQPQAEAYQAVANQDYVDLTINQSTIPLHAGTVRYLREIGADIPNALIPPEAK